MSGNSRLVELVDELRDRLRFEGFDHDSDRLTQVALGHRRILDALVAGTTKGAAAAAREHLLSTRNEWPAADEPTSPRT